MDKGLDKEILSREEITETEERKSKIKEDILSDKYFLRFLDTSGCRIQLNPDNDIFILPDKEVIKIECELNPESYKWFCVDTYNKWKEKQGEIKKKQIREWRRE